MASEHDFVVNHVPLSPNFSLTLTLTRDGPSRNKGDVIMPLHSYLPESLSRTPCAPVLQALFSYDGEHNAISKHFNGPGIRPIPATELALSEVFFSLRGTSGNYGSMQLAIRLQAELALLPVYPSGSPRFRRLTARGHASVSEL